MVHKFEITGSTASLINIVLPLSENYCLCFSITVEMNTVMFINANQCFETEHVDVKNSSLTTCEITKVANSLN